MRKNIKKFAGIVLCIGMFTGCAQTPDSSLVKPKGSKAVDAYTEADDVSGSKGEASESKNDDGSESKTTIRNLIDAPQNYKSHVEDDSAKLVVNTDASVEIPEVEKISAISVTAAEVTQELLDRITNAFFSEAKLYTMDSYYVKTKDEIKKTLDELKEDVANGNLDPYNYGTDDDGNYVYDIYEDIETWEQEYETAPEKKTLTEAKPVAGNFFDCIAQMSDDSQYYYKISSDGSDTLSVKIKKAANKGGEKIPEDAMWCDYGYSEEEEKPTEESIGLSLDEAKKLVKKGVTEIILIAQDTTSYGIDIYKKPSLPKLLEELNKIEGLGWIRFMYAYPTHLDDELLDSVSKLDKIVKYVDIPLQHSHPEVLKLMNRPAFDYRPMIENIRKRIPDVSIRTAFIVGYPGETEEHFEHLCNFVRDMKFDRMGVFKYSREKFTPSYKLPNRVPAKIANQRYKKLMEIQQEISAERNKKFIGKTIPCIIECFADDGEIIARTQYDAPEIDGIVNIQTDKMVVPGDIEMVKITDASEYDLIGEI